MCKCTWRQACKVCASEYGDRHVEDICVWRQACKVHVHANVHGDRHVKYMQVCMETGMSSLCKCVWRQACKVCASVYLETGT
jgi:hypothetical protein